MVALYDIGVCRSQSIQIGMQKMAPSRTQSVTAIPVHRGLCHRLSGIRLNKATMLGNTHIVVASLS